MSTPIPAIAAPIKTKGFIIKSPLATTASIPLPNTRSLGPIPIIEAPKPLAPAKALPPNNAAFLPNEVPRFFTPLSNPMLPFFNPPIILPPLVPYNPPVFIKSFLIKVSPPKNFASAIFRPEYAIKAVIIPPKTISVFVKPPCSPKNAMKSINASLCKSLAKAK